MVHDLAYPSLTFAHRAYFDHITARDSVHPVTFIATPECAPILSNIERFRFPFEGGLSEGGVEIGLNLFL